MSVETNNLMASLLSPDELAKHQKKVEKKTGIKSTGTGVYQKRHTPYKIIHTEWVFKSATVKVFFQDCSNCGGEHTYSNNHVLFRYERTKKFKGSISTEDTLDIHETYRPRPGVRLPDDIHLETDYVTEDIQKVAYCQDCAEGLISTRHLMENLSIPYEEDEVESETGGKELVVLEGEEEPAMLTKELLKLLDEEEL